MAPPFQPVDVPRQARRRRLPERGAEDGARNLPAVVATEMALAEQEIVTDISADRERCARDLASQLRAYRDALSNLQTGMDIAGLRHAADEAILRFNEIRSRWSGDIGELRRAAAEATAELREFKERNRLSRAPRPPRNRLLSLSLLFLFVTIESGANGFFFAGGSDLGLLGGVTLAMGLSLVNVLVGTLSGLGFLRLMRSARWLLAAAGLIAFFGTEAGVLVINGLVAHYRDIYDAAGDATKVGDAWARLIDAPFAIQSMNSWLLFAAGLFFSGMATWKGYGLDDPYPGYGAAERRRQEAVGAYHGERDGLIDEAGEIADDYSEQARAAIEVLRASSSQRQQIQNARARALADFTTHENDLAHAAHQLLTIYREANTVSRTAPPPRHFDDRFTFPDRVLERPEFLLLRSDQGLEHDADTLIAELDGLRRRVHDEHALVLAQAPGEV